MRTDRRQKGRNIPGAGPLIPGDWCIFRQPWIRSFRFDYFDISAAMFKLARNFNWQRSGPVQRIGARFSWLFIREAVYSCVTGKPSVTIREEFWISGVALLVDRLYERTERDSWRQQSCVSSRSNHCIRQTNCAFYYGTRRRQSKARQSATQARRLGIRRKGSCMRS